MLTCISAVLTCFWPHFGDSAHAFKKLQNAQSVLTWLTASDLLHISEQIRWAHLRRITYECPKIHVFKRSKKTSDRHSTSDSVTGRLAAASSLVRHAILEIRDFTQGLVYCFHPHLNAGPIQNMLLEISGRPLVTSSSPKHCTPACSILDIRISNWRRPFIQTKYFRSPDNIAPPELSLQLCPRNVLSNR